MTPAAPTVNVTAIDFVQELGETDQLTVSLLRKGVCFTLTGTEILLFVDAIFGHSSEDKHIRTFRANRAGEHGIKSDARTLKIGRFFIELSSDELKSLQLNLAENSAMALRLAAAA